MVIDMTGMPVVFNGMTYDSRHGGPFDRGTADSYYHRAPDPHYYVGDTYRSDMVEFSKMTTEEIDAYMAGYEYNEQYGEKKDWGND